MNESTEIIVGAIVGAALWLAWGLFSDTRHNHGFLVAFLIPLALILIPVLFIVFVLIKYTSYFIYVALGRREDHEEFMRKVKTRSGVFLFF